MKKLVAITLLYFYFCSYAGPYLPAVYSFLGKTFWKISFSHSVKNMPPRTNILDFLKNMAKHNNPKQSNSPLPDSINQASSLFKGLISNYNHFFFFTETVKEFFAYNMDMIPFIFSEITTPPPKVA